MLIDSHCHVDFNAFKDDADEVIKRSLAEDIWLINVGSQFSTSERAVKMTEAYPQGLYAVVGLHPIHLFKDITETTTLNGQEYSFKTRKEVFDKEAYRQLAMSSKKVVGLGETGLDYSYLEDKSEEKEAAKNLQKEVFSGFIDLAEELDLPLVIHCRGSKADSARAYDDLLNILTSVKNQGRKIRGVVHCFGGTLEQAKQFIELGYLIGFTGIVTFKKGSEEMRNIAMVLPLDKILVETDAPFLSPEPYRGKRNEPAYVRYVAEEVAKLRNVSFEEVAEQTTKNARELFGI